MTIRRTASNTLDCAGYVNKGSANGDLTALSARLSGGKCAAPATRIPNFTDSGSIDGTIYSPVMGGSILIVEEDGVRQRLIAASLERAGYFEAVRDAHACAQPKRLRV